jgi:murein DD-endopeptidase MepM/ murein hydrolase activator NlpD
LPDPTRHYRRLTQSNLPTRLIAHLSVICLVAVATLAGVAHGQGSNATGVRAETGIPFVTSVRGANDGQTFTTTVYDPSALSEEQSALNRGAPATVPNLAAPKPTPVPVDPNATPLPPPSSGSGQASTAGSAPSTRAAAPAPAPTRLVWPVPGGSISQYFHAGHLALDIAASYGSQVVAAQGGVVTWAGWRNNGGGYVISIDHGNGMRTSYNHLGGIWVSPGQYVGAGQGIGSVGCTGICTGPHVHFEVIVNGIIDNPLRYF